MNKHREDIPTLIVKLVDIQLKMHESTGKENVKFGKQREKIFSDLAFWFGYEKIKEQEK